MRPAIHGALIGLAALTVGCAPTGSAVGDSVSAPRECFYARHAQGFSTGDDGRIYVRTGVNDIYEMQVMGVCPDIDWTHRIGIDARGAGARVCTGFDADLIIEDSSGAPQRCLVRSVRKLSEAEIDALD